MNIGTTQLGLTVAYQHYPLPQVTEQTDRHMQKEQLNQLQCQPHWEFLTMRLPAPVLTSSHSSSELLTVSENKLRSPIEI